MTGPGELLVRGQETAVSLHHLIRQRDRGLRRRTKIEVSRALLLDPDEQDGGARLAAGRFQMGEHDPVDLLQTFLNGRLRRRQSVPLFYSERLPEPFLRHLVKTIEIDDSDARGLAVDETTRQQANYRLSHD